MPGISDVGIEFERFAKSLGHRRKDLFSRIGSLRNGFEGWVKLEFFFWLVGEYGLRIPTPEQDWNENSADIGLEYKVRLDQRWNDREVKHCDLWIRDDQQKPGFHYVELKAPFANANMNKMLTSAASDFWCMSRIRKSYEQAVSGNAIVLGVGFNDDTWVQGIDRVRTESGVPEEMQESRSGVLDDKGQVRFSVLTRRY